MTLEFKLTIDSIDLFAGSEDVEFAADFVEEIRAKKFSMNGGLFVLMHLDKEDEIVAWGAAYVARRVEPVVDEPSCKDEARMPEFMEYRAVGPQIDSGNWAAELVNSLIAENRGKLPDGWLEQAMKGVETSSTKH
ncbi:hypothetical protein RHVG_00039 [Rhodovulum phage RS1]|uniref:hypothetical protein n=1 Tax=Rhodobacter phage RC1 TaxID=754055 RepID=UPI0002C18164|nr:hypothetical protein RHWG_00017 [Rhodobacter phage RC1]YP_007676418.1 hypothetical protein RHVG_00039 [Rhodovulum phage RS1]AGH58004.1 hypothetical protein RHVG_00039 [Rhodovulum phage RS1]AGH58038.1 hypothetical protein RHWG_00017 [Rhodobacter phage RC1]